MPIHDMLRENAVVWRMKDKPADYSVAVYDLLSD